MIQGALFGQGDEDGDSREPNDYESTNDESNASFEPAESVNEEIVSTSDEAAATSDATDQLATGETTEEIAVAAHQLHLSVRGRPLSAKPTGQKAKSF